MLLVGCSKESFPKGSTVTSEQMASSPTALLAMVNGMNSWMGTYYVYSESFYSMDFGYPGICILRECLGMDMPNAYTPYDYASYYFSQMNSGVGPQSGTVTIFWQFYYKLIKQANDLIKLIDVNTASETQLYYLGIAYAYRASAYLDLARMYEYNSPEVYDISEEIRGLTVPIVTEATTEDVAKNNPRASVEDMYNFILSDLSKAEEYMQHQTTRLNKNTPDIHVIYGLKARIDLEIATRCRLYNSSRDGGFSDITAFGFSSIKDCYAQAAANAKKAYEGFTVLSESEWHSPTSGFNDVTSNSWIWGIILTPDSPVSYLEYGSFVGTTCSEIYYGMVNYQGCYRMIDKSLYDKISDTDWRKYSWFVKSDISKFGSKYKTSLSLDVLKTKLPDYSNLKFRPAEGNTTEYKTGCSADFPMMRAEEMRLIEAEALAFSEGLGSGISALTSFMVTRDPSYKCTASSEEAFEEELLKEKRIELWGEGLTYFDFKRLDHGIARGYKNSNWTGNTKFNYTQGVAPWYTISIYQSEVQNNPACKYNPDPTGAFKAYLWSGN